MEQNNNENKDIKTDRFLIGFFIGLGGWITHILLYTLLMFIKGEVSNVISWAFVLGKNFFIYGWWLLAIIAGIIAKKKGNQKAFSFVAFTVMILIFIVGGCTGLFNS